MLREATETILYCKTPSTPVLWRYYQPVHCGGLPPPVKEVLTGRRRPSSVTVVEHEAVHSTTTCHAFEMFKNVGVVRGFKSTFPIGAFDPKRVRMVEIMLTKRVSKNCNYNCHDSLYLEKVVVIYILLLTHYAARVVSHMGVIERN